MSCRLCERALLSLVSVVLQAISSRPAKLAFGAAPLTPMVLLPAAAATPAAEVPCPS